MLIIMINIHEFHKNTQNISYNIFTYFSNNINFQHFFLILFTFHYNSLLNNKIKNKIRKKDNIKLMVCSLCGNTRI